MKEIYLTALTNERYLPGALALVRSLKEVKTQYDIAIMIPESQKENLTLKLQEWGIIQDGVFTLVQPDVPMPETLDLKDYYWLDTFFKIQAASCTEYDKILLLDCDQMAVKNFDHLFEKSNIHLQHAEGVFIRIGYLCHRECLSLNHPKNCMRNC